MECCWCVSKHKSWLLILMMIQSLMVWQTQGVCIEEERNALLEIKTSLVDSYDLYHPPPTWVDDGDECCDWERVKCNTTTGHVTDLSLGNMIEKPTVYDLEFQTVVNEACKRMWPLNVSLFLEFKELRSLNLSYDCLDDTIVSTGLGSLKKLEILDLSSNYITNEIFPSLGALTSLRALHLVGNNLKGYFPAVALENLEILDLSFNHMQGFDRLSLFKKLKFLKLRRNNFYESLVTSISHDLPLLQELDLSFNFIGGSFPAKELANLTNLETLDLSRNFYNDTPSIQDCKRLSRLKKLESVNLGDNPFNKSIISCLSALPFLRTLDLSYSQLRGSFPIQGMF